jgi:hypothetical protein
MLARRCRVCKPLQRSRRPRRLLVDNGLAKLGVGRRLQQHAAEARQRLATRRRLLVEQREGLRVDCRSDFILKFYVVAIAVN